MLSVVSVAMFIKDTQTLANRTPSPCGSATGGKVHGLLVRFEVVADTLPHCRHQSLALTAYTAEGLKSFPVGRVKGHSGY